MLANVRIMMVGCGSMGSAMIRGWAATGVGDKRYTIVTPHESSVMSLRAFCDIDWYASPDLVPTGYQPDVLILAVKPQKMSDLLPLYAPYAANGALIITVAAGKSLESYRAGLGENTKLVRVMPNLPVAYGKGMTIGYTCKSLSKEDLSLAHSLYQALGEMLWIEDEQLFDVSTTISGCGPAYLYLLTDALTKAAIHGGLHEEQAQLMARQAMIGGGVMLDHTADSAELLKQKVASPGGVTEAALKVLEQTDIGLPSLMNQAIQAAIKRAKELSNV